MSREENTSAPNFEEANCNVRLLVESVCNYFSIEKPIQKQGAPSKANEADLVVVIKAMGIMMERIRKEKDEKIEELKVVITNLTMRVKHLEEKPEEIKETVEVKKPLFSEILSKPTKHEINIIAKFEREQKEIMTKEKNIIVFGVKNNKNDEPARAKSADEESVREIFKELDVDGEKIKHIRRINNKNEAKSSPIIVELKESKERWKILKNAKKLRDSEKFSSVFLAADLTVTQRAVQKELLAERNKRNEQLKKEGKNENFYFGIRGGSVVKIQK